MGTVLVTLALSIPKDMLSALFYYQCNRPTYSPVFFTFTLNSFSDKSTVTLSIIFDGIDIELTDKILLMKILFTLILIFFLLRLILKPLLRLVIGSVLGKMAEQGGQFQRTYTYPHKKRKPEGTIEVEVEPKHTNRSSGRKDTGEYVDYEEVK